MDKETPLPGFFKPETMQRLHEVLVLSSSVKGFLDWPTGLLRINYSVDEVRAWLNGILEPAKARGLEELLFHEVFHFLQISSSAYLFFWVNQLNTILVETLTDPDIITSIEAFPSRVAPDLAPHLKTLLADMDEAGPSGVTVRALVESVAFLTQARRFADGIDSGKDYLGYLSKHCPADEYRKTFDVARTQLGEERAFAWLPLMTNMSLATKRPVVTYCNMCQELSRRSIHKDPEQFPVNRIQAMYNEIVPDCKLRDSFRAAKSHR